MRASMLTLAAPALFAFAALARAADELDWSNVTLATCDPHDPGQKWKLKEGTGLVVDEYSGRCLTLWACEDAVNQPIVVQGCGKGCTAAKPGAQQWKWDGSGKGMVNSLAPDRSLDASASHTPGESAIVAHITTPGGNQQWTLAADGTIKPGASTAAPPTYTPPCAKMPCCLKASTCLLGSGKDQTGVPELASGAVAGGCKAVSGGDAMGWGVVIAIGVSLSVYVGGGMGYGVKVQGKSVGEDGVLGLHPNRQLWSGVVGLVVDGCMFTLAKIRQLTSKDYEAVGSADGAPPKAKAKAKPAAAEAAAAAQPSNDDT